MGKLVGIITAWAAEPFIEPAMKQALEYCDEVIVNVSCHHAALKKYEDETMDICLKYKNQIHLIEDDILERGGRVTNPRNYVNKMLSKTDSNKKGNWVGILDADEFYFPKDINNIKDLMKEGKVNNIETPEKVFVVNTKHYATNKRTRFKKILEDNTTFIHSQIPYEKQSKPFFMETDKGMFHYTLLANPRYKSDFWRIEYGHPQQGNQPKKWGWVEKVYPNLDLDNQIESVKKCKELAYGNSVLGHLFPNGCKSDGTLHEYHDLHPPFIEEAGLTKITDFRKMYI